MAGDVMVALEGSFMTVQGDNLDNQVTIARAANGNVVVSGQTGTLINGLPSVTFLNPSLNALDIRMENGNDIVNLRGLQVANDLFADLGEGNDRLTAVAATPNTIGANMTVEGGLGNDLIQLNRIAVGEDLKVEGGLGTLTATIADSIMSKSLTVIGDDLVDVVTVRNTRIALDASFETKGGNDRVTLTDVSAFNLGINTDANDLAGLDRVTLTRVNTVEDLGIFTGAGNDVVQMTDVGSGKSITVSLDSGNDRLTMARVRAAYDAVFEGGAGSDTADYLDVFGGTKREFKEFETIVVR